MEMLWLDTPFHKNNFSPDILNDEDVSASIQMSFDGSIVSVKKDKVEQHYIEQEVELVKAGYKEFPYTKKNKIENIEEFYRFLSFFVDI